MQTGSVVAGLEQGDTAALARAISLVENQRDGFEELLAHVHKQLAGTGRRIGVTGPPGAGKSTLLTRLVQHYRTAGLSVAVVAVDPTSPYSGGALLGDRIRMEAVSLDPGVFIRSMASRGSHGGLATTTAEVADVLEAFGFDRVIIETVGVGQTELDVARTADTTVLVLVPESGDGIQALKAGVMEIADVFVVNKGDRPGADNLRQELQVMLGIRRGNAFRHITPHHRSDRLTVARPDATAVASDRPTVRARASESGSPDSRGSDAWDPPVVTTVAVKGEGLSELAAALDRHHAWLDASGLRARRRGERLVARTRAVVDRALQRWAWSETGAAELVAARLDEVAAGRRSPYDVAAEVMSHVKTEIRSASR
jgi:LAO/AO transport system kinase